VKMRELIYYLVSLKSFAKSQQEQMQSMQNMMQMMQSQSSINQRSREMMQGQAGAQSQYMQELAKEQQRLSELLASMLREGEGQQTPGGAQGESLIDEAREKKLRSIKEAMERLEEMLSSYDEGENEAIVKEQDFIEEELRAFQEGSLENEKLQENEERLATQAQRNPSEINVNEIVQGSSEDRERPPALNLQTEYEQALQYFFFHFENPSEIIDNSYESN
jgi:hypothetical protein